MTNTTATDNTRNWNERLYGPHWVHALGLGIYEAAWHENHRRIMVDVGPKPIGTDETYYCGRCATSHRFFRRADAANAARAQEEI